VAGSGTTVIVNVGSLVTPNDMLPELSMKLPWAASPVPPAPAMNVYVPTGVFAARVKFSVSNGIVVVPVLATAAAEAAGALSPTSILVRVKFRLFASPVLLKVAVPGLFAVLNGELNDPIAVVKKLTPE